MPELSVTKQDLSAISLLSYFPLFQPVVHERFGLTLVRLRPAGQLFLLLGREMLHVPELLLLAPSQSPLSRDIFSPFLLYPDSATSHIC